MNYKGYEVINGYRNGLVRVYLGETYVGAYKSVAVAKQAIDALTGA